MDKEYHYRVPILAPPLDHIRYARKSHKKFGFADRTSVLAIVQVQIRIGAISDAFRHDEQKQ